MNLLDGLRNQIFKIKNQPNPNLDQLILHVQMYERYLGDEHEVLLYTDPEEVLCLCEFCSKVTSTILINRKLRKKVLGLIDEQFNGTGSFIVDASNAHLQSIPAFISSKKHGIQMTSIEREYKPPPYVSSLTETKVNQYSLNFEFLPSVSAWYQLSELPFKFSAKVLYDDPPGEIYFLDSYSASFAIYDIECITNVFFLPI
jgi:hypothetical protein